MNFSVCIYCRAGTAGPIFTLSLNFSTVTGRSLVTWPYKMAAPIWGLCWGSSWSHQQDFKGKSGRAKRPHTQKSASAAYFFLKFSFIFVYRIAVWIIVQLLTDGCMNPLVPSISHYWWSLHPIVTDTNITRWNGHPMAWSCPGMALTKHRPKPREHK